MFKTISWGDYFSTLTVLLVVYYVVIGYLFFKTEALALIGIKVIRPEKMSAMSIEEAKRSMGVASDEAYMPKPLPEVDLSPVIQSFKDEVSAYLLNSEGENIAKAEALYAIELIAAKYPVLNDADCRQELLEHIQHEAQSYLPSFFKPEDFRHLFVS